MQAALLLHFTHAVQRLQRKVTQTWINQVKQMQTTTSSDGCSNRYMAEARYKAHAYCASAKEWSAPAASSIAYSPTPCSWLYTAIAAIAAPSPMRQTAPTRGARPVLHLMTIAAGKKSEKVTQAVEPTSASRDCRGSRGVGSGDSGRLDSVGEGAGAAVHLPTSAASIAAATALHTAKPVIMAHTTHVDRGHHDGDGISHHHQQPGDGIIEWVG